MIPKAVGRRVLFKFLVSDITAAVRNSTTPLRKKQQKKSKHYPEYFSGHKMSKYEPNSNRNTFQPDPNCRTCTDFKSWAKKQRDVMQMPRQNASTESSTIPERKPDPDCPLDKNELGRNTWSLLHTIGVTYPEKPTDAQKHDVVNFMNSIANLYPCEYCARDLKNELIKEPVDASSQDALSQWLCRLHNKVNAKIGKPTFDCSKVYERWRDGWLDGSCD